MVRHGYPCSPKSNINLLNVDSSIEISVLYWSWTWTLTGLNSMVQLQFLATAKRYFIYILLSRFLTRKQMIAPKVIRYWWGYEEIAFDYRAKWVLVIQMEHKFYPLTVDAYCQKEAPWASHGGRRLKSAICWATNDIKPPFSFYHIMVEGKDVLFNLIPSNSKSDDLAKARASR